MSFGQGNIVSTVLPAKSGSGGIVTADNGLTINPATNVQLGGVLIQDTDVDLSDFGLQLGGLIILTNPFSSYIQYIDSGSLYFEVDAINDVYAIGDINNNFNGIFFEINDASKIITIFSNGGIGKQFEINIPNETYKFGEIAGSGYGLFIDVINDTYALGNQVGHSLNINTFGPGFVLGTPTSGINIVNLSDNTLFAVNMSNNNITLDDINNLFNVTNNSGQNGLNIDFTNNIYKIGDIGEIYNSNYLRINDTEQSGFLGQFVGSTPTFGFGYDVSNPANHVYSIGEAGFIISMQSNTEQINLIASGGIATSVLGTPSYWLLGNIVSSAATFDPTRYVQVQINGTLVKLGVIT